MSTMLLMARMPTLSIFARNHCGLGPTFTLAILRTEKNGHSRGAEIFTSDAVVSAVLSGGGSRNFLSVSAAISRARPKWLSKSPRFGVISTSRIVSLGNKSEIGAPICASGDKINRPDASSPRPSSIGLQSIPSDSTPRSLLSRISVPFGNFAPGNASGTLSPTL
jgi:hypothetical protein